MWNLLLLFLVPCTLSSPARISNWHGRNAGRDNATLTAACGISTSARDNPWASILFWDNAFLCGATLLQSQLAVTAAHCVTGRRTDFLVLYYGATFQPDSGIEDRGFSNFGGSSKIQAVRIHPNYETARKFEGLDVAVLKLKKRMTFNEYVKPIEVVKYATKYNKLWDDGAKVEMAGFGQISGPIDSFDIDDYPVQMQLIQHRIIPQQQCNRGNKTKRFGPPRDALCTRGRCRKPGVVDTFQAFCPGDSGSGVTGYFQEENRWYLVGIASYRISSSSADCGKTGKPAFSISARFHRDFIYEDFPFSGFIAAGSSSISTTTLTRTSTTTSTITREGVIFVVGGRSMTGKIVNTVEGYNPILNRWSDVEPMFTPRLWMAVAVMDNKFYAIGGYNDQGFLNSVEVFDPKSRRWSHVAAINSKMINMGAVAMDDKLYVIGGWDGNKSLATVESFEVSSNEWTMMPSLIEPRRSMGVVELHSRIYIIGGDNGRSRLRLNNVEVFDGQTKTWRSTTPMIARRSLPGVAKLNGKIYVAGGYYDGSSYQRSMEVFDPVENKWTYVASMKVGRIGLALVAGGGQLWAIGGWDGDSEENLDTVEKYDPDTDSWTHAQSMQSRAGPVSAGLLYNQ